MKQSLQLRISQHLALTPQLQQSIRLLQLSTLELHKELEQILSDNPLLERLDDPLDQSVRLLADGAIGAAGAPAEGAVAETPAPETNEESFDGGDNAEVAGGDGEWTFDDVARTSKAPEDDDSRPQLEAHEITLREHLLDTGRYRVRMTRDSDVYITLKDRVEISRKVKADLFVSVHADKYSDNGVRGASGMP